MIDDDPLVEFLLAGPKRRFEMAQDPQLESALRSNLGEGGLEEYRTLARKPAHLAPGGPPNLLFVPGVMGSMLMNEQRGGIWWIDVRTRQHLDGLALAADGLRDADPANLIRAVVADTSYQPFFDAVNERSDLAHESLPYDWRKPLTDPVDALADRVQLMRSHNGNKPVHLVGHSMGGILIRTALWQRPELWDLIGNVVFVGTPHYGSPAIAGYLKNHFWGFELLAVLGRYLSRPTLRSMWGVLSLLPAPSGIYPGTRPGQPLWHDSDGLVGHPAANFDLYDVAAYDLDGLSDEAAQRLQRILSWVAEFHTGLDNAHRQLSQPYRNRMLTIAGVGQKTLFRLERDKVLRVWEHTKKITDRVERDPHREGDGRVPVASAQLPDTLTRYVKGVHGGLTNIEDVWNEVFGFLNGDDLRLPDHLDAAHLGPASWSVAPALDGTLLPAAAGSTSPAASVGDPGYLQDVLVTDERFEALDAALDRGELSDFARVRIF